MPVAIECINLQPKIYFKFPRDRNPFLLWPLIPIASASSFLSSFDKEIFATSCYSLIPEVWLFCYIDGRGAMHCLVATANCYLHPLELASRCSGNVTLRQCFISVSQKNMLRNCSSSRKTTGNGQWSILWTQNRPLAFLISFPGDLLHPYLLFVDQYFMLPIRNLLHPCVQLVEVDVDVDVYGVQGMKKYLNVC